MWKALRAMRAICAPALSAARSLIPFRPWPSNRGERAAALFLERAGWEILEANLRLGRDEADLLCLDERGELVVVEVKSSRGGRLAPELQVGRRKQAALRRIAEQLARHPRAAGRVPRVDILVVDLGRRDRVARHLRSAVGGGERRVR